MESRKDHVDRLDVESDGDIGLQGMSIDESSGSRPSHGLLSGWIGALNIGKQDVQPKHSGHKTGEAKKLVAPQASTSADSALTHQGSSAEKSPEVSAPSTAAASEASSQSNGVAQQDQMYKKRTSDKIRGRISSKSDAIKTKESATNAVSPPSPNSRKREEKEQRKMQRRISRFHDEIAGPIAERLAAGSSGGPSITPRRTSVNGQLKRPLASPRLSSSRRSSSTSQASSRRGSTPVKPSPFTLADHTDRSTHVNDKSQAPPTTPRSLLTPTSSYQSDNGLDVGGLQRWILSVGCVNFDLDKGPDLEFLYPSLGISQEERDNIAFSSFPDTSIFDDGSAIFSWRVREVPLDSSDKEAPYIASPLRTSIKASKNGQGKADTGTSRNSAQSDSLSRKGGQTSSARRILGGLERAARGTVSRSSSTDDHDQESLAKVTKGPVEAVKNEARKEQGSSLAAPAIDARRGSVASSSSIDSAEVEVGLQADPIEHRVSTPVIANQILARAGSPQTVRKNSSRSVNYIHGYCFFRQKRDARIRRGYFQKSIVILSHLPYVSFFSELVRRLGPLFFETGMPVLEAFCHDVQNWETPEPGAKLHLPLLGSVISVELPYYDLSQTSSMPEASLHRVGSKASPGSTIKDSQKNLISATKVDGSTEDKPILASIPTTPLIETFSQSIDDLWLLWECVLLAEPILVVGSDPTACSEAIWHMLDLIKPIPYAGDFRPYFTIHDYDFRTLVTKNKPTSGTILGVTNPFMLQACKHWPHVVKVGRAAVKQSSVLRKTAKADGTGTQSGSSGKSLGGTVGVGVAGGSTAGGGGPEHSLGLLTKRKRRVSKDRILIKQAHDALSGKNGSSIEITNDLLSKYFADLTERFLAPLNRYVSSLIPAHFDLSSPLETPNLKSFSSTAFLASLKQHGTPLLLKSRNLPTGAAVRQSLYTDFIQCPNFSLWLHSRIRQSQEEQYQRKLTALATGNVLEFATSKGELEAMELYTRLQREIKSIDERLVIGRKESELKPNSRWKVAPSTTISVDGTDPPPNPTVEARQTAYADGETEHLHGSSLSSTTATSSASTPLLRLAALSPSRETAAWIRQTISEAGWTRSFTHGERTLLIRKAELIEQLHRLIHGLQPDLRAILEMKDRQKSTKDD
jgi:hypothetical protein